MDLFIVLLTSSTGLSGSSAQQISPKFVINEAPDQKAVTLSFASDEPGDKIVACSFKYVPFRMKDEKLVFLTKQGKYTYLVPKEDDTIFRTVRLENNIIFEKDMTKIPKSVYKPVEVPSEESVIKKKKSSFINPILMIVSMLLAFVFVRLYFRHKK